MGAEQLGFIGLGAMGSGLAHNLQAHLAKKGEQLHVHNRTKDKPEVAEALKEGAKWVDSPAEIAASCSIVFSIVAADAALETVFSSYLSGKPKPGSIFVDCSTVYPDLAEDLEARAQRAGVAYLTSPVFGRPDAARAGKTLVVSAGEPSAKAKVRPYLEAMGRGVLDVGDSARLGNVMKLVGNFYIMSMTELIAEGMTVSDKNGLPRDALVTFLKECFGPISGGYAERVAKDAFKMTPEAPGFSAKGGLKDATHVQNLAKASGVTMPVADIVVANLKEVNARGGGDTLDWASLALLHRERVGIKDRQKLLQPK